MKRHITHTPLKTGGQPVESSDFAQLPSVLTSREAANVLRVGVREVGALVDSGQLPGTRVGPRKVVRISRAAVLALLGLQALFCTAFTAVDVARSSAIQASPSIGIRCSGVMRRAPSRTPLSRAATARCSARLTRGECSWMRSLIGSSG